MCTRAPARALTWAARAVWRGGVVCVAAGGARGGVPGQKSAIFSGLRGAVAFRKAAFAHIGLEMPEQPANKLIIFNRENAGRAFENIAEMVEILKKYKVRARVGVCAPTPPPYHPVPDSSDRPHVALK
jgi:hypothetical protein